MALLVIVLVEGYSIRVLGIRGYLRRFTKPFELPIFARIPFTLINIVEEIAKPISLSLRLFGNMFAGGILVGLIALFPWYIQWAPNAIWKTFDLFVGLIQAFIFALLTILYFSQSMELDHADEKESH